MGCECSWICEALVHLPDERLTRLLNGEGKASGFGAGQRDVIRQVFFYDRQFVGVGADQLSRQANLRHRLLHSAAYVIKAGTKCVCQRSSGRVSG